MKNILIYVAVVIALVYSGCTSEKGKNIGEKKSDTQKISTDKPNVNQFSVEQIDKIRQETEALQIKAVEVSTKDLREKIKQKWSKIHFYAQNGVLIKVKTYPHEKISKRTEEFYANKDGLVLVVIEDNGEGNKGKSKDILDKMYYFNDGKIIKEINNAKEKEYSVKEGDAEELLSEFKEYSEIYSKIKP